MPIHDWTRVDAGIFHFFHQRWIGTITDALNQGLLPRGYYALSEQHGAGYEPDVLALKARIPDGDDPGPDLGPAEASEADLVGGGVLVAEPKALVRAETELDFYRRKQEVVAVRHVSRDELVAVVEVVSRGNKSGRPALDQFVRKATEFLHHGVHLLVADLQPPTSRDPNGLHGAIWDELEGEFYRAPSGKPLTLAAYESSGAIRAFVEPVAVGDEMIDMPLFLRPGAHVPVPLEATYRAAWEVVPRRWRDVVAG